MKTSVLDNSSVSYKSNCLNFIRIFAAMQVMLKHFIAHLGVDCPDWLSSIIGFFGGVPIFFAISGMLIWFSIGRSSSFFEYIKKRFIRIYPELWVAVIIGIIAILIFYREWKPFSLLLFALGQATFVQFWTPDSLNGYGCGAPNGALWTIGITIQFYLIVWFVRKLLHKKRLYLWIIGFFVCIGTSFFGNLVLKAIGSDLLLKLFSQTVFKHLWLFYIGCMLAEFFDRIIPFISKFWFAFLLTAAVPYYFGVGVWLGNYNLFWALPLCIGVIGFAYAFPKITIKTDVSYGLFLYHMTVANVFISLGAVGNWVYLISAVAVSFLFASVSTVLFLNIKRIIKSNARC